MTSNPTLPVGHQLSGGRYQILKKLGEGGYGSVYLASDTRLAGRKVAIKELHDPAPAAQQLFQREAALLASLNHAGLVRVSDFFNDGTSHFLVMDYIDGRDLLETALEAEKARRLLPADKVADWILQVCGAVAYLHQLQPPVIHRDIKPANIRLNTQNEAILVDFGIAKIDPKAKTHLMAKAVSLGFSPPEQYAGGGGTDARSDVYALGATMYCLLTVQLPPDGFERLTADKPLPPPRQFNRSLTPALENIVLKAMALNSLQRYQDAGEMLAALRTALGKPAAAPLIVMVPAPSSVTCPQCGTLCRSGAHFCARCRHAFGAPVIRCSACGTPARNGARFCAHCRAPLSAAPGGAPTPPRIDPRQASQHVAQGDQFARAQQFDRAASEYEAAHRLGVETAALYTSLGRCYNQLDRYDDTIDLLEAGARQHSADAALHTQLALAYLGAEKFSQAIQTLELAYQLAPDNDDLALLLTNIYFDMGKQVKALPILEQLHRRQPQHELVRYRLAVGYLMADRLREAEKLIKDLQRANPNLGELSFLMGVLHRKQGNPRQALKDLQAAVQRAPDHALAWYIMGEVFMEQKKWREAIAAYEKSAIANPRDADPHAKLCLCYLALSKPTEAAAALARAVQIDSNNQIAQGIMKALGS
jgi:serine/threonine-protein kinase